ncbi:c-type cytochrome [Planctellipticum variicoloris]|uniref:c-type cytochrome n=1 Tax=Planctellipticum variicoloris TaxID=3064265 RepID=UPI0030139E6B|nr:c-type cytochrome [Planctomycetaceae bacterium SH412]
MKCRSWAVWSLLAGSLATGPLTAADTVDGKVYTQVPEVVDGKSPARSTAPDFSAGPVPAWIWGPNRDTRYFLKQTLPAAVKSAWIKVSADNHVAVWLNGQKVGGSDEWQAPATLDLTKSLKSGENTLILEVWNDGGISAALAKVVLSDAAGKASYLVTDESWAVLASKDSTEKLAVETHGELGVQPWGDVFSLASNGDSKFNLLPGFQAERLFTVPKDELGSWVCLVSDGKGRFIASDQGDKGLYRITPPAPGSSEPTKVEKLDVKLSGAQGMLFAFNSLYVTVNGGPGSGLYRLRDTNDDDQFDELLKLKEIRGGGEHGPHALRLSPDGKSIYLISGNHTLPPFDVIRNADPQTMGGMRAEPLHAKLPEHASSRLSPNWDEDLLLPRQWDANGHARGVLAPGGWIASTDPDGKNWEFFSSGYRNPYDMAFNADGELFAYDADMEWDMGMPWYRPTRVVHATSGSEFGWRSGTGKWPTYYVDSLPQMIDIGPGSPVGVEFGHGTKFPAKYQRALYILDWTFGTMYAIHMEPEGASYRATKEEFVSRTPLPLTDAAVGVDGALYFTVGGRGTQSELFRVTYVGNESTAPATLTDAAGADLRALRRKIETYQSRQADAKAAVSFIYPHLSHADRHIRYAARVALEWQDPAAWRSRVLAEENPDALIQGIVALARVADKPAQIDLLNALGRLEFAKLSERQQLDGLRALSLVLIRLGEPTDPVVLADIAKPLIPFYPAKSDALNRELCMILTAVQSPEVAARSMPLLTRPSPAPSAGEIAALLARNPGYGGSIAKMIENQPDLQKLELLFTLRNLKTGWTIADRKIYFDALKEARSKAGGASYQGFLKNIDRDAFENATEKERLAIEAGGAREPFRRPELPKPAGPGHDWTSEEVVALGDKLKGRDFKNGEKMFAATRCVICHRFAGDGGATGPDLTQLAGRFNLKDLTESIIDPNKVVSDQYRASLLVTDAGKSYTGRLVSETKNSVTILTDPEDSTKVVEVPRSEIEELRPAPTSLMPKDLLKPLNETEVLDLLAYLLSRGDPGSPMFRK